MDNKHKIAIAIGYYLPQKSYLNNDCCIPLQLGFEETGIDMGIHKDNTGDNRSKKHPIYSEYSGIYWIWKNVDADYKGMLHHRRFFTNDRIGFVNSIKAAAGLTINYLKNLLYYEPCHYSKTIKCLTDEEYHNKVSEFTSFLPIILSKGYDIVAPTPYKYYHTRVRDSFSEVVTRVIQAPLIEAIFSLYPEYKPFFDKVFNGHSLYYGNMTIMRSDLFDSYCKYVFDIFDYIENYLVKDKFFIQPCEERALYRMFGYIGELLTSTFIMKSKEDGLKIKECNILFNKAANGNEATDYKKILLK